MIMARQQHDIQFGRAKNSNWREAFLRESRIQLDVRIFKSWFSVGFSEKGVQSEVYLKIY